MRPSILLVGHEDVLIDLSELLEPVFDVAAATSANEAFIIVEMFRFDMVILLLDALPYDEETFLRLREMPRYGTIPLIACCKTPPEAPYEDRAPYTAWLPSPLTLKNILSVMQPFFD